jgi:hypothetical protein
MIGLSNELGGRRSLFSSLTQASRYGAFANMRLFNRWLAEKTGSMLPSYFSKNQAPLHLPVLRYILWDSLIGLIYAFI